MVYIESCLKRHNSGPAQLLGVYGVTEVKVGAPIHATIAVTERSHVVPVQALPTPRCCSSPLHPSKPSCQAPLSPRPSPTAQPLERFQPSQPVMPPLLAWVSQWV